MYECMYVNWVHASLITGMISSHQVRATSLPVCEEEYHPAFFCVLSLLHDVYSGVHKPRHLQYKKEKEKIPNHNRRRYFSVMLREYLIILATLWSQKGLKEKSRKFYVVFNLVGFHNMNQLDPLSSKKRDWAKISTCLLNNVVLGKKKVLIRCVFLPK